MDLPDNTYSNYLLMIRTLNHELSFSFGAKMDPKILYLPIFLHIYSTINLEGFEV